MEKGFDVRGYRLETSFKSKDSTFSKTWRATQKCDNFVLKMISFSHRDSKHIEREKQIYGGLKHRNIITVYEVFTEKIEGNNFLIVAMEDCPDGDFNRLIQDRQKSLTEKLPYMLEVARGLAYLHEQRAVHRNIKAENLMICGKSAKISDLGLAKIIKANYTRMTTRGGNMNLYIAPEMHQKDDYGFQVDIWSLGLVFLEVILGKKLKNMSKWQDLPFKQSEHEKLKSLIDQVKEQDEDLWRLIKSMISINIVYRINAQKMVSELERIISLHSNKVINTKNPVLQTVKSASDLSRKNIQGKKGRGEFPIPGYGFLKQAKNRQSRFFELNLIEQEQQKTFFGREKQIYLSNKQKIKANQQRSSIETVNKCEIELTYFPKSDSMRLYSYDLNLERIYNYADLPCMMRRNWDVVLDLYRELINLLPEDIILSEAGILRINAKIKEDFTKKQLKANQNQTKQVQKDVQPNASLQPQQFSGSLTDSKAKSKQQKDKYSLIMQQSSKESNGLLINSPKRINDNMPISEKIEIIKNYIEILKQSTRSPSEQLGLAYQQLGISYNESQMYIQSIQAYEFAIIQLESAIGPESRQLSNVFHNMANNYMVLQQTSEAIKLYKKSLNMYKSVGMEMTDSMSQTYFSLATAFLRNQSFDEAKQHYLKALNNIELINQDSKLLKPSALCNLGVIYVIENKYQDAASYLQVGLEQMAFSNMKNEKFVIYKIKLMEVYEAMKNVNDLLTVMAELFDIKEFYPQESNNNVYEGFKEKCRTMIARLIADTTVGIDHLKQINTILMNHFPEETNWLSMLEERIRSF